MKGLFVSLFCILAITVFCQKPDYIINNNGDTIWGNITVKNKLFFVDGTQVVELAPEEIRKIRSIKYRGNTAIRCSLQNYTDNLTELDFDYIKRGVTDTILILEEIYITPKIILYGVKNNIKTQFYFYKTPSDPKPVQLIIRYQLKGGFTNYSNDPGKYRGEKSQVYVVEDKGYVNQLHAIMGDCSKIPPTMWELLTYRDYSLKQLIKKYNKCK